MTKTVVKPTENLSWEALRRKADLLGVPAWKLAEELGVHDLETSYPHVAQAAKL